LNVRIRDLCSCARNVAAVHCCRIRRRLDSALNNSFQGNTVNTRRLCFEATVRAVLVIRAVVYCTDKQPSRDAHGRSLCVCEKPTLTLRELEAQITELAGHLNVAQYRWLLLIAEFDERHGWSDGATQSCAHWLNWQCGIDLGAAREKVRVAHALRSPADRRSRGCGDLTGRRGGTL
jgi:hypothetical protein